MGVNEHTCVGLANKQISATYALLLMCKHNLTAMCETHTCQGGSTIFRLTLHHSTLAEECCGRLMLCSCGIRQRHGKESVQTLSHPLPTRHVEKGGRLRAVFVLAYCGCEADVTRH